MSRRFEIKEDWSWSWFGRRRFELLDDAGSYWEIQLLSGGLEILSGSNSSTEQRKTKLFGSTAEAKENYDQLMAEKLAQGYVEVEATSAPKRSDQSRAHTKEFIAGMIESPYLAVEMLTDKDTIYGADKVVFWIDFKEEDEWIIAGCENILQTGHLAAELIADDSDNGYEIDIRYQDKRAKVPLSYSHDDRHITICALNKILSPDYEIRFCIDCNGETLAFLPLAADDWKYLENRHGHALKKHFYKIAEKPNLYTDPVKFANGQLVSGPQRQVAFALRDIDAGEIINAGDFAISAVDAESAPKDAILAIDGAQMRVNIKKGEAIRRAVISNIPGNVSSYST